MHQVQLVILSDQPSSNLCPLLDQRLKPDEVILATPVGERYQEFQQWFIDACEPLNIKCSVLNLPEFHQIEQIKQCFEETVNERLTLNQQLTLNCSAGDKPLGIIANNIFSKHNLAVFFVKHDWVHWLNNPQQQASMNLEDSIKIPTFLASHGLKVTDLKRKPVSDELHNMARQWLSQTRTYTKAMGILNYYAARAQQNLSCKLSDNHFKGHSPFTIMLDQLEQAQLVSLKGNILTFKDEDTRFFANGGWLEDQVFSELQKLRGTLPKLQDVARCVEIEWKASSNRHTVKNELDVIALYDNRLIVIECKTKRFDQGDAKGVVYKLGSMIKHLGGVKSNGAIISFQHIASSHIARAQLMDIFVCEQKNLAGLSNQLKQFLSAINN